ncbi:inversin-like [Eriocheir sinensis]|uniref:inversin-like n=1 Tax=Eriocheir sinensis TaxID=95602 RepID=UPI0021C5A738|nr:inversin-like [Eriocheir sinensis]
MWLAQDVRGVTPLHHAAVHSNHKCLQALLKYAVPGTLDTEDHKKRTPLHWAAAYGSQENVRLLIKYGANNLMPDQEGKTPLHWAAMSEVEGAKDCVRTLIGAAPSSVNWQDYDGITALHLAVAEARKDTVDVILSVPNCNVALTDNQFRTALHWACSRGLSAIAALLMKRISQVDAVDIYGATPLHYAAQHNHAECVELLMRRQRTRDISSSDGHTSLMWAAAQGADSALTAMVRQGASLTQADPRGCTALHIAAGTGHSSTVRLLLCLQAPPDVCANDGRTPVHFAARAGHTQIVKELAKAGASLQRRDEEGQCALHHAVLGGHLFLAQILIRAGTSVNVQDYYGRTPLHMAAYRGLSDIMFLLLENRGDVNARDFEGLSALHWAAEQGHLGAVNTLLDFHAYPNYTQSTPNRTVNFRYTPYDCACVAEHLEVAQVLAEAGGISVTEIMEVAATRIQAAVRGHLARSKLKMQHGLQGNLEGKTYKDENARVSRKPFSDLSIDTSSNKLSCSETVFEGIHTSKQTKNSAPPVITAVDAGNREERGLASKPNLAMWSAASAPDHGPYNSVSGQRRSKALPASIMRGAGKKTLRNLELPGLIELGIKQPRLHRSSEYSEDSDSGTDTIEEPRPLVADILQQSSSIATAVVTAGGNFHHTHEEDKPNVICGKQSYFNLSVKTNTEIEVQQEKNSESISDAEKIMRNYCKADGYEDEENSSLSSFLSKSHLISFTENQIKQENNYQEKLKDSLKDSSSGMKDNKNKRVKIKKGKQTLEEKNSSQCTNDEIMGPKNIGRLVGERRVLSEEAVKQAERKWKNKLATVTLQRMQGADGSKSEVTVPYSLMKPHNPAPPASDCKVDASSITTS